MIRTYWWSATFESDDQPPQTARGEIHVPNARLGARRAVEGLYKAFPRRQFRSLVVVLDTEPPSTPPPSRVDDVAAVQW